MFSSLKNAVVSNNPAYTVKAGFDSDPEITLPRNVSRGSSKELHHWHIDWKLYSKLHLFVLTNEFINSVSPRPSYSFETPLRSRFLAITIVNSTLLSSPAFTPELYTKQSEPAGTRALGAHVDYFFKVITINFPSDEAFCAFQLFWQRSSSFVLITAEIFVTKPNCCKLRKYCWLETNNWMKR